MTLLVTRTAEDRCPACGAANAACGGPSDTVPIDQFKEGSTVSGPLQKYRYRSGRGNETVLKLSEADAERLGLGPDDVIGAPIADAPAAAKAQPKGKPAAANKARTTTSNKAAGGTTGEDGGPGGGD